MLECPELSVLEGDATSAVRAHLAECSSCRIVVDLLDERRRGIDARERHDECAKFEMLLAARDEGTIGGTAGALLEAHLRVCPDCQAVAATMPPPSERREHSSLPPVSTAAYALGREVARGGMGRILEAHDVRIGRPVAVKELLGKNPSLAARFEREARVTARLQHPGIVPIYEIGKWPDGTPFYAMRMVEGRTLREAIRDKKSLDERLALLPGVIAAADAVAFAHGKRIIHRDLTPNNILVGEYGDTVVIDWGLAKDLSAETGSDDEVAVGPYRDEPATAGNLTSVGAVIGTAAYMPPEQANGAAVDERADVYALGAILYHLLAGEAPYRASKSEDVVRQVQEGPPPAIHEVAAGAPRDLVSLVEKTMDRDPDRRYPTAAKLVAELRRFQTGRLVEAHHYSRGERVRRWIRDHRVAVFASAAAMVAVAVAGSVGFAGIVSERDHAEQQTALAIEQRRAADVAKAKAEHVNLALMSEQGRQELVAGNTTRALAWLNEAYKAGDTSPELRFMLGTAMRRVESVTHTFDCKVANGGDSPAISFSPDGTRAMAACEGGIGIARLSDWKVVTAIATTSHGAVWSHDSLRIASKKGDTISVWDAASGAQVFATKAHAGFVRSVMFTPDDHVLVTTGDDAKVRIWDVATGRVLRTLDAGSGKMNVVRGQLTPDGRTLVTVTSDGVVKQWDVATGARGPSFTLPSQPLGSGSLSPDGTKLATCHVDGNARVSELATGRLTASFAAHAFAAFDCQWAPNGRLLVTTGADGTARVWDIAAGQLVSSLELGGMFSRAVVSPDSERVATVSSDGVLRLWHATTGSLLASLDDPAGVGEVAAFSNDGGTIVTVRDRSTIVVLTGLDAGLHPVAIPPGSRALATSPSAGHLAVKHADGSVEIVDTTTLAPLTREALREPVAWSHDGRRVAAAARGGAVVLDAHDGHVLARLALAGFDGLALDEHGRRLLVASEKAQVWDVDHDRLELALDARSESNSFSPAGDLVIAWHDPRHVDIWSVDEHKIQARAALDDDMLGTVGFAADGKNVLLGVKDAATGIAPIPFAGRVGGYDLVTGTRTFELPHAILTFLSPDRRRTISSGISRDVEIRDASDGHLVSRIVLGSELAMVGTLIVDGTLLFTSGTRTLDVRSPVDGRLLARAGGSPEMAFTQDTFEAGLNWDFADNGNTSVSLGAHPMIWRFPNEQRSPAEVDRIVREHVRWRIVDGRLVPLEATVHGRVVRHGRPVAGAEVSLVHIGVASWPHVATDSEGRFSFDRLPPGNSDVLAMAPDRSAHGQTPVTIDRADVVADIDLDEEATISGQVVDDQGAPVAGLRVTAIDTYLGAETDAGGSFTIRALRPGRFEVGALEARDGKPTGWVHVGAATIAVEIRSKTDALTGVKLVVRRAPAAVAP
jgi:WD40 repeat protein